MISQAPNLNPDLCKAGMPNVATFQALLVSGIGTADAINKSMSMYGVMLTCGRQVLCAFQNALDSSLVALFLANLLLPSCRHCLSVHRLSIYSLLTQQ